MKLTPKTALLGYVALILAAGIFFYYWYYLLEPLQAKLIEAGKNPNLFLTVIRSLIVGSAFAFLTFVGMSVTKLAWQKWATEEKIDLGDALESREFLVWAAWTNFGFLLFSLFWHFGNF